MGFDVNFLGATLENENCGVELGVNPSINTACRNGIKVYLRKIR